MSIFSFKYPELKLPLFVILCLYKNRSAILCRQRLRAPARLQEEARSRGTAIGQLKEGMLVLSCLVTGQCSASETAERRGGDVGGATGSCSPYALGTEG